MTNLFPPHHLTNVLHLLLLQVLGAYKAALQMPSKSRKAALALATGAALLLSKAIHNFVELAASGGAMSASKGPIALCTFTATSTNRTVLQHATHPSCAELIINMLAAAVAYNKGQRQHSWRWKEGPLNGAYTPPGSKGNGNILLDTTTTSVPDYHAAYYPKDVPLPEDKFKQFESLISWPAAYFLLNTLKFMIICGCHEVHPTAGQYQPETFLRP